MMHNDVHGTVFKTDAIPGTKQVLAKPKRIRMISIVFSHTPFCNETRNQYPRNYQILGL